MLYNNKDIIGIMIEAEASHSTFNYDREERQKAGAELIYVERTEFNSAAAERLNKPFSIRSTVKLFLDLDDRDRPRDSRNRTFFIRTGTHNKNH